MNFSYIIKFTSKGKSVSMQESADPVVYEQKVKTGVQLSFFGRVILGGGVCKQDRNMTGEAAQEWSNYHSLT